MEVTEAARYIVDEIERFEYSLSSRDRVWNILYPDEGRKWHHAQIVKYENRCFITIFDEADSGIEVGPGTRIGNSALPPSAPLSGNGDFGNRWMLHFNALKSWLSVVKKDWIQANRLVYDRYPPEFRWGLVPNVLIRASLNDVYRVDRELGVKTTRKFIRLVEEGYFSSGKTNSLDSMTADDYFEYCRVAYTAGRRKREPLDVSLSGREMYRRYADGRHEGLLDIDGKSATEFAQWIDCTHPKRTAGGHPWEIKRGGNTTHIDLSVSRPPYRKEGFRIELRGQAVSRLGETVRMFLAIAATGKPITIADPEGVRKRLLAQDNIGIVPSYNSLHRANQYFREDDDVYDVMHYSDLGRYKRRIRPFITWRPLPVFKPRQGF